MTLLKRRLSLYTILAAVIVVSVALVMFVQASYSYVTTKAQTLARMQEATQASIHSLRQNMAGLMEAYAVNEYDLLIRTEMERQGHFAIVVEDFNMGLIVGEPAYISGQIRHGDGNITAFDPADAAHQKALSLCLWVTRDDIFSRDGTRMGSIIIYNTDEAMRRELTQIVLSKLYEALALAFALTLLIVLMLRGVVLRPLLGMVSVIRRRDADGIPLRKVPEHLSAEISELSISMNAMIDAIRASREAIYARKQELQQSNERYEALNRELDSERKRFMLAIEGSQNGLWDWDIAKQTIFFSARWKEMLGYAEEEIGDQMREWSDRVHPLDLKRTMKMLYAHLRRETPIFEARYRLKCKNGAYIWVLDRAKALFDDEGNPIRMLGFQSDITDQVRHQEALDRSAKHDSLTGLPNRFLFSELIQNAMHRCVRRGKLLGLLYIDLDGFKEVNDTYGHEAGDVMLITIAKRLAALVRHEDVVARLGGDEFVIAVADLNRHNEVRMLLDRLLHDLAQPILYEGKHHLHVSASIGVTFYPQSRELGPEALLRQADQAMYTAKTSGKNRYTFFNVDEDSSIKEHQLFCATFAQAITQGEMVLFYQPKVELSTGHVLGFEALLRWQDPQIGLRFPDSFLPRLQHEKSLMLSLGRWVFENAFAALERWRVQGYRFGLNINVSAHEFMEPQTFELLSSLAARYPQLEPSMIELEILESSALEETLQARRMIESCRQMGFRVALDDFGTGYSTLSYLKDLPVDTIKIDRSFVMDMLHDSASFSILEAALALAQAFRREVVAEGVESIEHGILLQQLGCTMAQGYAIAKPMREEEVASWVAGYVGFEAWRDVEPLEFRDKGALYALIEHRQWLKRLRDHLEDPKAHSAPPDIDVLECRFGQWLAHELPLKHYDRKGLESIDAHHRALHAQAVSVLTSMEETTVREGMDAIEQLHTTLCGEMRTLMRSADLHRA
ncbi:MAG: EAL domain-containing protein [Campylobacterales bacterium]|nr:EAL domain-containing protein [Campylobacterales bacterium]